MVCVNVVLDQLKPLLLQALGGVYRLELKQGAKTDAVRVDRAGFEAAILNLVINARDAMPDGVAVCARQIRPDIKVLLTSGYAHGAPAAHNVPKDLPLLAKPYRVEQLSAQFAAARSGKLQA